MRFGASSRGTSTNGEFTSGVGRVNGACITPAPTGVKAVGICSSSATLMTSSSFRSYLCSTFSAAISSFFDSFPSLSVSRILNTVSVSGLAPRPSPGLPASCAGPPAERR